MSIQPNQPQSIGGVLDTTFQLYKASVIPVLPLCVLLAIATTPPGIYMLTQSSGASAADPMAMLTAMWSFTYLLIYLVSVVATLWAMGAIYLKMGAIGADAELSNGTALQASLGRVPHLFAASILFAIALMIGLVLLILPGLILMVSLILCFNLVMHENKGPIDALTASHKLVWGNWWRTAAVLTVGFIVVLVLYVVVGMLVGVLLPLLGGGDDLLVASMITNLLLGTLLSLLLTPFYVAMVIALYWDLKLRKEGGDLASRVGALKPA